VSVKNFISLDRPLVWLDVETASIVPPEQARICELSFHMVYPDDRPDKVWSTLINPGVPIHPEVTTIHHITDAEVKDKPKFAQLAANLAMGFKDADYGGYNVKFDLRVLGGEFSRAGVQWSYLNSRIIDPLRIWQTQEPRTLTDAVKKFRGREPSEAHRASGDVWDAYDVFIGQLEMWQQLPRSIDELAKICYPPDPDKLEDGGKFRWKDGKAVITFGKHAGKSIQELPRDYLQWLSGADFSDEVKQIAREAIKGRFPRRQT
jgi:DNA polymerase III subunit epsilon